jgi:hypothetical protein
MAPLSEQTQSLQNDSSTNLQLLRNVMWGVVRTSLAFEPCWCCEERQSLSYSPTEVLGRKRRLWSHENTDV